MKNRERFAQFQGEIAIELIKTVEKAEHIQTEIIRLILAMEQTGFSDEPLNYHCVSEIPILLGNYARLYTELFEFSTSKAKEVIEATMLSKTTLH